MTLVQLIISLVTLAVTVIVGIIGYFLKRTIGAVDGCAAEIKDIKRDYATKDELDDFRDDIKDEIRSISNDIRDIKDNYLKKDDFIRPMAELTARMERIYNYLLDNGGGRHNG